ncbi:MAG: Na+/H+ antiporter NhaA [Agarilytica sp.]
MTEHPTEDFSHNRVLTLKAPWEKSFDQILTPFERFVKRQATAGLLLMFTALAALIFANSALGEHYRHMLHIPMGFTLGEWHIEKSVHHWINDGLMTLFFFVVGLELKREVLVGELANLRMAILPIVAAIGGMVMPALIYVAINPSGDALRGWGIPMATDIAFALGVIALLAGRVPKSLITFLVALAIVDDLGAIVIIALFYTEQLVWQALISAAVITSLMIMMNLIGVRRASPYFILGFVLWIALMKSGVHATLAGVISAFTIPSLPRYEPKSFSLRMRELLDKLDNSYVPGESILKNQKMAQTVSALYTGVVGVKTPLQRLENTMHIPVAFLVLPLFSLFNAGVQIDFGNILGSLNQPVVIGVSFGLMFGKLFGIVGFSWIALRIGLVTLPPLVTIHHILGAALLGSIGFTMSIFIAELAFSHQPLLIEQAKLGILTTSVVAGFAGYFILYKLGGEKRPLREHVKVSH